VSGTWVYDWLLSCPAVVFAGRFKARGFEGVVLLSLLYPRLVLLGDSGRVVKLGGVPSWFLGGVVESTCYSIACGCTEPGSFLEKGVYTAMFYGGYNVVLNHGGEAVPLTLEVVNTDRVRLYHRVEESATPVEASLNEWVLLGAGLRLGDTSLIEAACREVGEFRDSKCYLTVFMGELVVASKSDTAPQGYVRVVPDNNPARHVINYDRVKRESTPIQPEREPTI